MDRKTVLVTGSSRGIGKAIALKFAQNGYQVVINCARQEDLLMQTKEEIEAIQGKCLAYVGDMGNYDTVRDLFHRINETFGSLDVLVNNAGISHVGLFTDMEPHDWERVISANLHSAINCSHLAVPAMVRRKSGRIINISSVWGNYGASCEVIYSATKGAINAFTKALAKELAPSNIQVNAIACGAIDTQMNQFLSKEDRYQLIDGIPANRFGRADEVADLAFYLAGSNEYLTGQVITLDGGWM